MPNMNKNAIKLEQPLNGNSFLIEEFEEKKVILQQKGSLGVTCPCWITACCVCCSMCLQIVTCNCCWRDKELWNNLCTMLNEELCHCKSGWCW